METLASFFTNLAKHESTPATNFVAPWRLCDVKSVTAEIQRALGSEQI
jgi:hypothetical protein